MYSSRTFLISYSLFARNRLTVGGDPRKDYWKSLSAAWRAHAVLYPGIDFVLHHDDSVYSHPYWEVLQKLEEVNPHFVFRRVDSGPVDVCLGMLWRLLPLWTEPEGVWVFCRDLDSLPYDRDKRLVYHTMTVAGAAAHAISDHPMHTQPLMGGMVGFAAGDFPKLIGFDTFQSLISSAGDLSSHGSDQNVLSRFVWEAVVSRTVEHRFVGREADPRSLSASLPNDFESKLPMELMTDTMAGFIGRTCWDPALARRMYDKWLSQVYKPVVELERTLLPTLDWET